MQEATHNVTPFLALNDILQPEYRAAVIKRALGFRRQAPSTERQAMDFVLANYIDPRTLDHQLALDQTVLSTIIAACQHDPLLLQAVMAMWVHSQQPLARRIREFLRSQNLPTLDFDQLRHGFLGTRPQEEMIALVNAFHSQHPSFNTFDAALMLCCVYGHLPSAQAAEQRIPDMLDELEHVAPEQWSRWHTWLAELRALPIDAPEWNTQAARSFAAAVIRLAEQRARERQAIRARLQHALAQLRETAAESLAYFGFDDLPDWDEARFELRDITPLAEDVEGFATLLHTHRSNLLQAPAATRAEQAQRRQATDDLEATIERVHARLAAQMSRQLPPTPAAQQPVPLPPASEEPLFELAVGMSLPVPEPPHTMPEPRRGGLFRRR